MFALNAISGWHLFIFSISLFSLIDHALCLVLTHALTLVHLGLTLALFLLCGISFPVSTTVVKFVNRVNLLAKKKQGHAA